MHGSTHSLRPLTVDVDCGIWRRYEGRSALVDPGAAQGRRQLTGTAAATPPAWFRAALDTPARSGTVDSAGASVHYRIWGERYDGPGLLLVHGNTANTHWWDHVAPDLALDRRVVAMDLTGFGDSAHRPAYDFALWSSDIRAVLHETLAPGSVIVAHSMGGKPSYRAAVAESSIGGLVLLDSSIGRTPAADRARLLADRADSQARVFPTLDDAVRAYRLFRPVDSAVEVPTYLVEHIARHSVRQVPGGWSWKFDQAVYRAALEPPTPVRPLPCPVAVVRAGEHSVLDDDSYTTLVRDLGAGTVAATLTSSGHHVMLDDPLGLVTLLHEIVADWI